MCNHIFRNKGLNQSPRPPVYKEHSYTYVYTRTTRIVQDTTNYQNFKTAVIITDYNFISTCEALLYVAAFIESESHFKLSLRQAPTQKFNSKHCSLKLTNQISQIRHVHVRVSHSYTQPQHIYRMHLDIICLDPC